MSKKISRRNFIVTSLATAAGVAGHRRRRKDRRSLRSPRARSQWNSRYWRITYLRRTTDSYVWWLTCSRIRSRRHF